MIEAEGNRLRHLANGQFKTDAATALPRRLAELGAQLEALLDQHRPDSAAVEEVFVNVNPQSTLKLGQARGVIIMIAARTGIDSLHEVARALEGMLGEAESTKLAWKPSTEVEVRGEQAQQLMNLIDSLDEDDDVQTVWGNYDVPDDELEKLG